MGNFKKPSVSMADVTKIILCIGALVCFGIFFFFGPAQVLEKGGAVDFGVIAAVSLVLILAVGLFFTSVVKIRSTVLFACALAIAAAALAIRFYLFDHASNDYNSFLSVWLSYMRTLEGVQPIVEPIGDYNMPYLYFLFFLSRNNFCDLYMIKLLSVVFDFVLAGSVALIAHRFKNNPLLTLASFTAALFLPTVFLNSAYWGQCDGIYAALCMLALYFAFEKKGKTSMVLFALAFSFKIQSIFILPIIIFLVLRRKVKLFDLLLFPATFVLTLVPAMLCGRSFYDTFSIYLKQTESYPALTLNCPTLWALFPDNKFEVFGTAALFLAGAVCLVFMAYLYINRNKLGTSLLFDAAFIFTLILPFFLPRMHERYFYLAEVLSVLYLVLHKNRFIPLLINLTSFSCYCTYLFGYRISSLEYLTLANLVIIIYVAKKFADDVAAVKLTNKLPESDTKERL